MLKFFSPLLFVFSLSAAVSAQGYELSLEEAKALHPRQELCDSLVRLSKAYVGKPYKYGAIGPESFDCSGYVRFVFDKFLMDMPHSSKMIGAQGEAVERADLRVGDLVLFMGRNAKSGTVGHVGIVTEISEDEIYFIHASTSSGVREDAVYANPYFGPRLLGFRTWEW